MINKTLTVPGSSYLVLFLQCDAVCVRTTDQCWSARGFGPRSNSHVTPVDEQRKPKLVSNTILNWTKLGKLMTETNKQTKHTLKNKTGTVLYGVFLSPWRWSTLLYLTEQPARHQVCRLLTLDACWEAKTQHTRTRRVSDINCHCQ